MIWLLVIATVLTALAAVQWVRFAALARASRHVTRGGGGLQFAGFFIRRNAQVLSACAGVAWVSVWLFGGAA